MNVPETEKASITEGYHSDSHEHETVQDSEDSDGADEVVDGNTPIKKKAKRLCHYRPEWNTEFPWSVKSPGNCFASDCTFVS